MTKHLNNAVVAYDKYLSELNKAHQTAIADGNAFADMVLSEFRFEATQIKTRLQRIAMASTKDLT